MAIPDILINIATALDWVEAYIDGDTSFNPKNTLNGIRISLTTARGLMQRHAQDAINMQGQLITAHGLLNNTYGQINNLMNDMANRRRWWQIAQDRQTNGQRIALRKQNRINVLVGEKTILQLINQRRKAEADLAEFNWAFVFNKYQKWKGRELNSRQIILNLQNNPLLGNMAEARRQPLYDSIGTIFAKHDPFTGQEPPNEYLDRIWNSISHLEPNMTALENANAGDFNDAIKFGLLKTKLVWMNAKYQRETIGTQQSAIQKLSQERFLPTDSPDTYEKRIRPLLLGVANNDATTLSFLKNHLLGDFYTWMKIANPANIDAYFTELKNLWLERNPIISSSGMPYRQVPIQQLVSSQETAPIQPQKDDFKIRLARDLAYTGIGTYNATLENFIYEELKKRLGGQTAHVRKSPFIPRSAYATKKVIRKVVPKASAKQTRHCSACGKTGHTKINCPRLKQTKKVNYVYQNEEEDPEDSEEEYIEEYIEDSEEEEVEEDDEYIDADESQNCYTVKKKYNIDTAANYMFQIALKSSIASLVPHCPREILIEISKFINMIFPKIKDHCLNTSMPNDTVKRRESAWRIVASKFEDILFPLLQAVNSEQKPLLQVPDNESKIKEINTASSSYVIPESIRHIYWPKTLEINFLQTKDADDVATISCKVGSMTIPYAMIDSGSDSSIVSENVAKHLGLKIDKKKIHRLNGVASKSHSLGTVNSVPVTIEDGENRDTISDEFSVVPTEYDDNGKELSLFILGTQWQYRAGWEPLVKGEFKATQNGKTITIPLSVHKSQRNVFTVEKEPEPVKKN
ncbi:hypothetical protein GLOIN_2v1772633 [Rhizophagus clarus]|uniref:CCHC-type domain-containing protein n=2 Tax=Rhizophagus clarus TaxID=94130 RepID=A0A8H3LUX0_9GLOM|nr:hypothetical protein GLOIN_2v1772633 [Rhizophagus clarus]